MKKILIFSVLVFSVVLYSYFQVYLKKQKSESEKPALMEKKKMVGFHLTTASSEIEMKFEDGLWHLVQPHPYPADQNFVKQNLELMARAQILSTFTLQKDHFGLKPGKAFMELTYSDGLRRRLIIGKEKGSKGSLYIFDKDSKQVFLVHNVFGQFLYYPLPMFFSKNLPIPGKKIQSLKKIQFLKPEQSPETLWEITTTSQTEALVQLGKQSKKIPKENLLSFFKKIKEFEIKDHQFEESKLFKKTTSLIIKTEKTSITFDFDNQTNQVHSKTQNVFARFEPSSLKALDDELKKVMETKK